jgi:hypothetical protein
LYGISSLSRSERRKLWIVTSPILTAPCRYLGTMSLASVQEIAAIHQITDPWLRITSYKQARDSGGLYPEGPYSFEATLNVTRELNEGTPGPERPRRETRAFFLSRIEDALDALEEAGWHLTEAFSVTLCTEIVSRLGVGKSSLQALVGVTVSFTVDRHRTDEEMATTPEAMADRIFDTWARGEAPWKG